MNLSIKRKKIVIVISVFLVAFGITALVIKRKNDKREEKDREKARQHELAKKKRRQEKNIMVLDPAETLAEVKAMTQGKRAKFVWVENASKEDVDTFSRGNELRLVGYDTATSGYRVIQEKLANYTRPLFTPDGEQLLYTDKGIKSTNGVKAYNPTINLMNWDGSGARVLRSGFAVSTAKDAVTGKTWVYALESLNPNFGSTIDGENLVRFPLDDPQKQEPIWSKTSLSTDNLQFSRDGKRFSALFPWPEGGWVDLEEGKIHKVAQGCWISMAPDNSYLAWIFSGSHKSLRTFHPAEDRKWEIQVSNAPGVKNAQVYHPRWTNHPAYFTMTGPYPARKARKGASKGPIQYAGSSAEIYFGQFSPAMDKVERWARLTANAFGDFYPDGWIEGGETAELANFKQGVPLKKSVIDAKWPVANDKLLFVWGNLDSPNLIQGRHTSCRAIGRGIGRYGRQEELLLDGGWFETEPLTTELLAKELPAAQALTLTFQFAESRALPAGQQARLVALVDASGKPQMEVFRTADAVVIQSPAGLLSADALNASFPIAFAPESRHLAVRLSGGVISVSIDNANSAQPAKLEFAKLTNSKLILGEGRALADGWKAGLHHVSLYGAALSDEEISVCVATTKIESLPPAPRVRLRARLLDATEPDDTQLSSYLRMLVDHTYEVTEVLEGEFKAKQVVVLHWAILDLKPVPGIPREVGKEYELLLEPVDAHPQVASELQISESEDLEAVLQLDVSTPAQVR